MAVATNMAARARAAASAALAAAARRTTTGSSGGGANVAPSSSSSAAVVVLLRSAASSSSSVPSSVPSPASAALPLPPGRRRPLPPPDRPARASTPAAAAGVRVRSFDGGGGEGSRRRFGTALGLPRAHEEEEEEGDDDDAPPPPPPVPRRRRTVARRRIVRLPSLGQDGTLILRTSSPSSSPSSPRSSPLRATVVPSWRDDASIEVVRRVLVASSAEGGGEEGRSEGESEGEGDEEAFDGDSSRASFADGTLRLTSRADGIVTSLGRRGPCVEADLALRSSSSSEADEDVLEEEVVLAVPEKFNLTCLLNSGSIFVRGKVEGDVRLETEDGSVEATKLRGRRIRLAARGSPSSSAGDDDDGIGGGIVRVAKAIEAQSLDVFASSRVRARTIHGSDVRIRVSAKRGAPDRRDGDRRDDDPDDAGARIDVGSLYVSGGGGEEDEGGAFLEVDERRGGRDDDDDEEEREGEEDGPGLVRVKSSHGHVAVCARTDRGSSRGAAAAPLVELGGVNGSCDVELRSEGDGDDGDASAAIHVHLDALSPGSVSAVTSSGRARGRVELTVDRKVEADVRLLSTARSGTFLSSSGDVDAHSVAGEDDDDDDDEVRSVVDGAVASARATAGGDDGRGDGPRAVSVEAEACDEELRIDDAGIEYVRGVARDRSGEPRARSDVGSRSPSPSPSPPSPSRGKVDVGGAAEQALRGFRGGGGGGAVDRPPRPLVAAAADGRIRLETLSWRGGIARRYGLGDVGRVPGRQARRAPRLDGQPSPA